MELTHFNSRGDAIMVDVGDKPVTARKAVAEGIIYVNADAFAAVMQGSEKKGDVLGTARIAGILAAKNTSSLIPLCHTVALTKCTVDFEVDELTNSVKAVCTASTLSQTGVEMEALTGVSAALLTIYDMCKAADKGMTITGICLVHKSGGRSGVYNKGES